MVMWGGVVPGVKAGGGEVNRFLSGVLGEVK